MDAALIEPRSHAPQKSLEAAELLTLVCALAVEERAARRGGARTARVGLGASLVAPSGQLVSFGLAGALVEGLAPGALVTATQVVDEHGILLWEGKPLAIPGARPVVLCAAGRVIDDPAERERLAARTGAAAVDMESARLAETGRLIGAVRAISDGPDRPVGRLASASRADGGVAWGAVARAFLLEPLTAARAAGASRRAIAALERAARCIAEGGS